MLTLVFATALAAAPAPSAMPCGPDCSPAAMADCPMGPAAAVPTPQRQVERR